MGVIHVSDCSVIGVLDDGPAGLTAEAIARIGAARRVIGARRMLEGCGDLMAPDAEPLDLTGRIAEVPGWVEASIAVGDPVVVLATGDPLCFGIGGLLARRLDPAKLHILPNRSTLQLACARFRIPWEDARWLSVHHRDSGDWTPGATPDHGLYPLAQALRRETLLAVLTSPANGPARIARLLLAEGLGEDFDLQVAERLLMPEERLIGGATAGAIAVMDFADPNLVLLRRRRAPSALPRFGLPDDAYSQRRPERGLITKREVRAVALALLELRATDRVWDLGAGSGSVGLEAARLCDRGHVYAIEKNADDLALIETNRRALGIANYSVRAGLAPDDCGDWPDPDAVFIGGSSGRLAQMLDVVIRRLRPDGRLVLALVAVENLTLALATLDRLGAHWELTQIQAARSRPILSLHRLQAENPVWLVQARAPSLPPADQTPSETHPCLEP
ncbi:MAG: precorrin-6y C5,15-methyltransferase (decarboxylating) subunit CbiE [Thiocapsa sp.]|nr:MAG: precorrin-6y C5,15-methyltransferase (decarboxylating) subunit CbiE [Thiocapsa sp.]